MQCQKKPNLLLGSSLSIGKMYYVRIFYDHKSKFWSFFSYLCALTNCMIMPLHIYIPGLHNSDTNNVLEYLMVRKWAGLYITGCLVAALASTQYLPAVPTLQLWQPNVISRYCHMSPGSKGAKLTPGENHCDSCYSSVLKKLTMKCFTENFSLKINAISINYVRFLGT